MRRQPIKFLLEFAEPSRSEVDIFQQDPAATLGQALNGFIRLVEALVSADGDRGDLLIERFGQRFHFLTGVEARGTHQ